MQTQLPKLSKRNSIIKSLFRTHYPKKKLGIKVTLLSFTFLLLSLVNYGQWTAVTSAAPNNNNGVTLLLSNGTVMCKSNAGGGDGVGNTWNILTPDANGSYSNGAWTTPATMAKTRLYFVSQVLQDGRVYVAGGEYGTGGNYMEIYNPLTNTWSGEVNYGSFISDANSEILANSKVLVAPVNSAPSTYIWNPADNTFVAGPSNLGGTNESAWLKLPDGSILFVRTNLQTSERYIPATNIWQNDANVPVTLYSTYGSETGAAFMLPDGRAFFLGGNSNTAFYAPSGNTTNGVWSPGPVIPNSLSAPDAAAAMMRDGKILCAVSPTLTCCNAQGKPIFNTPTSFYVFDYTTNTFTGINAPDGNPTLAIASYNTNMLDLPNGQILYSQQGSNKYYVYTPGAQLAANRPAITDISEHADGSFTLTGTQINGWSEGAGYGDDWQMNTNYPIVQLTNGANVYYARSYNWSSTGILTGTQTTDFSLPAGLPNATYQLRVIANGIASDPVSFCTPHIDANPLVTSNYNGRDVSCFNSCDGAVTANAIGAISTYTWKDASNAVKSTTASATGLCPGTYFLTITNAEGCSLTKSVIVNNTPQLTLNASVTSHFNGFNISCFGGSDGTATATVAGGTTPYTYSWSNGQTSADASGLSATNYTVTVTDANGCTAGGSVTLTEPPKLVATAAPISNYNGYNVRCHGGSDGVAEAYPSGGVSPYTYLWSNGQTTKVATGLSAQSYSVTVTDKNGCTVNATTVTLTEPPQLTIDAGANKIVYYGYPDSSCAILTATGMGGGVPPYVITWSTGSNAASIKVCPMVTTVYTVTISDANGCSFSDQVTVCVIDVRCGNKLDKVVICHSTGSKSTPFETLCIDIKAAKYHFLNHPTDQLAACGTVKFCPDGASSITLARVGNKADNQIKSNLDIRNEISPIYEEGYYVKAFPNPFSVSSVIRFKNNVDDMAQLFLYDISGKKLLKLYDAKVEANKVYQVTLNRKLLSNGMYFLNLKTLHGNNYVGKLLIAK